MRRSSHGLWLSIMLACALTYACTNAGDLETMNIDQLPAFAEEGILHAVIEIPAGSSDKLEYDPMTRDFPVSLRNGQPRRIEFLPYPANYGFIPGTKMNKDEGGDGDALDVFVLCGAVPVGTVLKVEPIGIIELLDDGERDDKLVAVPVDPELRTMEAGDIGELPEGVRDILMTWLLKYDPEDVAELIAVKGREDALATVRHWRIKE